MTFNSFAFAAFFVVIYVLYLLSMRRLALQNGLLLIGSYFFYGCWDWRFLSLLWVSTAVDFVVGRLLDRRWPGTVLSDGKTGGEAYRYGPRARQGFLMASLVANLGMLGFFKYYDFFITSAADLLKTIGLACEFRVLQVILPVGISFYTFQTLGYTIDVYRGKIRAERSLLNFALFVSFFPQLVAGPILRACDFLPQIARPRRLQLTWIYRGSFLMLWGLFKKIVIADNLAIVVQNVFDGGIGGSQGSVVLMGLYAFAFQIYCDFSGYTDIARGCGCLMGFDLARNFNLPYFASNPAEFWRRWHITLSTWFRDYVYIPLGGNRLGPRRTGLNLMLTMALCGLWHGAAWTFVVWGIYHGFLLIGHRLLEPSIERISRKVPERLKPLKRGLAVLVCFHFICLGWLFFRAGSLSQATQMLDVLASAWLEWIIAGIDVPWRNGVGTLIVCVVPLLAVQFAQHRWNDLDALLRMPALARGAIYAAMVYAMILFGSPEETPFIYFQF